MILTTAKKAIHSSNLFFEDSEMKMIGSANFVNQYGIAESGHNGNGAAKITIIEIHRSFIFICTGEKKHIIPKLTFLMTFVSFVSSQ